MGETFLLEENPSLEVDEALIRKWAYDQNLYFLSQDEECVIDELRFVPLLLELASDPQCPKREVIWNTLAETFQTSVSSRNFAEVRQILTFVRGAPHHDKSVTDLIRFFEEISDKLLNPQPLTNEGATLLARQLLVGLAYQREFCSTGQTVHGYTEFKATAASPYIEYIYIHQETGNWVVSRNEPLEAFDLQFTPARVFREFLRFWRIQSSADFGRMPVPAPVIQTFGTVLGVELVQALVAKWAEEGSIQVNGSIWTHPFNGTITVVDRPSKYTPNLV